MYMQLIFDKNAKTIQWGKNNLFKRLFWDNWNIMDLWPKYNSWKPGDNDSHL
jgi:hypothetical protein